MKRFIDAFFARLFSLIIDHPWWVIAILLVITLLAGSQLPKIKIETDLKSILPYDEVYVNDERIRDTFTIKDFIIIGVKKDKKLFNDRTFEYIKKLVSKIELLDGVYKIRSLFSEDNIRNTPDGILNISPFVKEVDSESIKDSMEQVKDFEAVQGIFVSKDFTLTAILIEIEDGADKSSIYFEIKKMLDKDPPQNGEEIYLSGMPVFEGVLGDYILQDLMVMVPVVSLIVILFLFFTYRSFLLVGLSMVMVIVVNLWTLGFMAFLKEPLYIIQAVMPVILIALSVADEIHIFGRYFEECKDGSSSIRERVLIVMQEMWRPVILTSITTAFGFLALIMTSIKPLQYFGVFTAFGVMSAMMFAILATPAVLILFGEREHFRTSHDLLDRFLIFIGSFLFRNRVWARVLILIIIVFASVGMSKVFIQDSWLSNFKKSSIVYADDEVLNNKLSGTNILYVELDTGYPNGIKNPDFLKKVVLLQKRLDAIDGIGGSISIAQIIKKMSLEINERYDIPDTSNAIAQYILLLDGSTYERFWDYSYQKINIIIFSTKGDYVAGSAIFSAIRACLKECLPGVKATLGGDYMLSYHRVNLLRTDQVKSFSTSLTLILLVSSFVFWSFRKGVIVTAPILMAVVMNYGIMGFLKIPLSVSVSICSSIILGVGIDYAIHLQSKFDILSKKIETKDIMSDIFITAGKAIIWNAAVVITGFSVLIFSQMPPNQKLGIICSLGITTSLVSCFLVVPAFLPVKNH